jgi:hypothetical protein
MVVASAKRSFAASEKKKKRKRPESINWSTPSISADSDAK